MVLICKGYQGRLCSQCICEKESKDCWFSTNPMSCTKCKQLSPVDIVTMIIGKQSETNFSSNKRNIRSCLSLYFVKLCQYVCHYI